ncbi:MAG: hypothetical protein HY872_13980 [Chloroflexi bacterium]|nr:hypothetical protein [Chloroflexota bacterium]MBI5292978.1 hypothetical protein [Chloroflexota bacterium]
MAQDYTGYTKILLSYDIIPETQESYFQFMLGEMVPAVQRLGLGMAEAWHTAVGNYPLRLVVFVGESEEAVEQVLASPEWDDYETRLQHYVTNYTRRVVPFRDRFQF